MPMWITLVAGLLAAGSIPAEPAIVGVEWHWVARQAVVKTSEVPDPERYTLTLQPDGRVGARADCNTAGGEYELGPDQAITISRVRSTLIGCPAGSLGGVYLALLGQVTDWAIDEGELLLRLPDDGGVLRFVRAEAEPEP